VKHWDRLLFSVCVHRRSNNPVAVDGAIGQRIDRSGHCDVVDFDDQKESCING
jgi:hypothetical protein